MLRTIVLDQGENSEHALLFRIIREIRQKKKKQETKNWHKSYVDTRRTKLHV